MQNDQPTSQLIVKIVLHATQIKENEIKINGKRAFERCQQVSVECLLRGEIKLKEFVSILCEQIFDACSSFVLYM